MIVKVLGPVAYDRALEAMREFTAARGDDADDEIWLCEHPPVFTQGVAGRDEHVLDAGAIAVVRSDRGGQVTYHGPGQVVAYPLVDLRRLRIYVKELVFRIEQSVIQTLQVFGVDGRRVAGAPGVFTPWPGDASPPFNGVAKIAALGIKVEGGCSYHGVALNVA